MMKTKQISFIANKKSKEVHDKDCWWGRLISEENVNDTFESFRDALFEGYDSCGHCLPEYTGMINHGYLIINEPPPSINGEFILPGIILSFSKESAVDDSSIKVIIGLNKKQFEIIIQKTQNDFELIINRNKHVAESEEELNSYEKDILKLFLKALNEKYVNDSFKIKVHIIPIGRAVMTLLATSENPEYRVLFQEGASKSGILSKSKSMSNEGRYQKVKKYFANNPSVPDYHGKKASYFIGTDDENLDNSNFVHKRLLQRCVYIGQSVQAWWNVGVGDNKVWKKAWGIVGGINGDSAFGCSGTDDLIGDINMFTGWSYAAVDHDMCQGFEGKCLGPCTDELALGVIDFMARCLNQNLCDGKLPETYSDYELSDYEFNQGQYSFTEEHPMAGRKINTPSDWTVDTSDKNNKLWKGPPLPKLTGFKAFPNPFDQKTGTIISFNVEEVENYENYDYNKNKIIIELYHEHSVGIRPAIILKPKSGLGINQVYWDGNNAHGIASSIGKFNAVIKINGREVDKIFDFLTKKSDAGNPLPKSTIIENIKVSPNPFSIKTGTYFSFSLTENALVSIYIYHKTWKKISIKTVFQNRKLEAGNHGPFNWNGRNDDNVEVTNGEFKIKFVVNEGVKWYKGLKKNAPIVIGDSTSIPECKIIENVRFWPNPFSVDTGLNFSFDLKENANVSIYFFHKNWKNKGTRTFFENNVMNKGDQLGPYTWDGKNNMRVKVTNGDYKIRFVVNGEEKIVKGIVKERAKIFKKKK